MVSYTVLPRSIVVGISGKRFDIQKDDLRFEKVLALIKDKSSKNEDITEEEMTKVVDPQAIFGAEEGVSLVNGVVHIGEEALPSELSLRIIDMKKQDIPIKSLVNFWENLKKNPSMNSVQQLFKFLEHNGHPITSDGHFIAYRSVREDFKDFHTGTMDNSVGQTLTMPRNKVNDKPEETCSSGLHVASWQYAKGFGSGSRKMIEVLVSPEHVVCVPNDYNNTKMRVSQFTVLSEIESERRESFVNMNNETSEDQDWDDEDTDLDEDISSEDRDEVSELYDKYCDSYEDEALITRILEETDVPEETVRQIILELE